MLALSMLKSWRKAKNDEAFVEGFGQSAKSLACGPHLLQQIRKQLSNLIHTEAITQYFV